MSGKAADDLAPGWRIAVAIPLVVATILVAVSLALPWLVVIPLGPACGTGCPEQSYGAFHVSTVWAVIFCLALPASLAALWFCARAPRLPWIGGAVFVALVTATAGSFQLAGSAVDLPGGLDGLVSGGSATIVSLLAAMAYGLGLLVVLSAVLRRSGPGY